MNGNVKVGTVGEERFVVGEEHVIEFAFDGMPKILSTPRLIGVLERVARNTIAPQLETGEASVGVSVSVDHLAATPLTANVICRARVVYADGTKISFQLEAYDDREKIAVGTHKRRVIRSARLAQAVDKKR